MTNIEMIMLINTLATWGGFILRLAVFIAVVRYIIWGC